MWARRRRCPYCKELIQAQAVKCKHCGEWLENGSPDETAAHIETKDSSLSGDSSDSINNPDSSMSPTLDHLEEEPEPNAAYEQSMPSGTTTVASVAASDSAIEEDKASSKHTPDLLDRKFVIGMLYVRAMRNNIIRACIALCAAMLLYPPWQEVLDIPYRIHRVNASGYSFLWKPPAKHSINAGVTVDYGRLLLQCSIVAGVGWFASTWTKDNDKN